MDKSEHFNLPFSLIFECRLGFERFPQSFVLQWKGGYRQGLFSLLKCPFARPNGWNHLFLWTSLNKKVLLIELLIALSLWWSCLAAYIPISIYI